MAAVGDLHCREDHHGRFRLLVKQVNAAADLLLLCGDLTDRGMLEEGLVLAEELSALRVPCAAVLGNHDYEHGQVKEICGELAKVGVHVLDGDHFIFEKALGVAGVKGFAGGFGNATLQAFGEPQTKAFVQEAVSESLKLEAALSHLDTPQRVVIMHYAPIPETLEGENVEIRPFLGTSRLSMPIDHYGAAYVFHGHAHHGSREGRTKSGIPVYNVAMPLLAKYTPEQRFVVLEV
ncbi:metallophosphoesterase [Corallococcus sp. H22C18031201]|uniref:metallophosphoesterase family protein n=1 Tax=Citreicoccus inhibens TaxID=2849499 RepID=UPI000E754F0D|nr:metallophosphoesterase [Citreicoccus inhibens]MBU8897642.1 metallophosphoesterase [Citreicoccus inhibens]RJS19354.1 metallophosphoesterase [Corallococcus sp. H22C18031201]